MRFIYIFFFIIVVGAIIASFIVAGTSQDRADNIDKNNDIKNNKDLPMDTLKLTSSAFGNNGEIPSRYTCDGESVNPPFDISGVDENAKSLVLIVDDPDAPSGVWDHWVRFNIPASTTEIKEAVEPEGISGVGTSGNRDYLGPCPSDREHRYFFKLFSLDTSLSLEEGVTKKDVEKAMEGHILQDAELIGRYERNN